MHAPLRDGRPSIGPSVWLNAMAAVAVGMFIGNWVIGPAISSANDDRAPLRSAESERAMIDAMSKRPDPSPYRTPTPTFDLSDAPHYGTLAKEQALAALGRQGRGNRYTERESREAFGFAPWSDSDGSSRPAPRRNAFDRHTGIKY